MTTYIAILETDDAPGFGVFFPDLPGCTSGGDTAEEAMSNAAIALHMWSEGVDEMPEASSLAEVCNGNREILDAGGFPFSVPFGPRDEEQREFDKQMAIAERIMYRDRDMLKALAKL